MDERIKNWLIIASVIIVVGLLGFWMWWDNSQPGKLDDFTKCLGEKGLKFYGAFWCSHCESQKDLFGKSKKYLPYIECSAPDSKSQLEVCRDAKIKVYPTWEFTDGSREEGELSLEKLSEKSGCALP